MRPYCLRMARPDLERSFLLRSPVREGSAEVHVLPDHCVGRSEGHSERATGGLGILLVVAAIPVIQDVPLPGLPISDISDQDAVRENVGTGLPGHQVAAPERFGVVLAHK